MLLRKRLTLVAIVALAHWFFGNLYEAFVISPNWVTDSPAQMRRLNEFFVLTSPTHYFVPITLIGPALAWTLLAMNRDPDLRSDYARAGLLALFATVLNVFIVATLITRLFGPGYAAYGNDLASYCWRWNVLNVFRMILTGAAAIVLFGAFRKLDRRTEGSIRSSAT